MRAARDASSLLDRLRAATGADHSALEQRLDLLAPPLRQARFVELLEGFYAFYAAFEPRACALLGEAALAPRRRLRLIEDDLRALGAAAPDPLARDFDLGYLDTPSAAWGALYVMEGSSLGGQLIARALAGAPWTPPGGLRYFNPYGARTGEMWRGFRSALEGAAPGLDGEAAGSAALRTFGALRSGLLRPAPGTG